MRAPLISCLKAFKFSDWFIKPAKTICLYELWWEIYTLNSISDDDTTIFLKDNKELKKELLTIKKK